VLGLGAENTVHFLYNRAKISFLATAHWCRHRKKNNYLSLAVRKWCACAKIIIWIYSRDNSGKKQRVITLFQLEHKGSEGVDLFGRVGGEGSWLNPHPQTCRFWLISRVPECVVKVVCVWHSPCRALERRSLSMQGHLALRKWCASEKRIICRCAQVVRMCKNNYFRKGCASSTKMYGNVSQFQRRWYPCMQKSHNPKDLWGTQ